MISDSGCNLTPDLIDIRVIGEVIDRTTHYIGTNGNPYVILGVTQTPSANSPGIIDSQTDVHDYTNDITKPNYSPNYPWGPYNTFNVPLDTDHDGLPDWWERIKGFNTNSPAGDFSDSNGDPDGDGYSNLEDYLNWMAQPHYDCTNGTTLDLDLTQFTRGYTNNSPTYTFLSPTNNGTVTLLAGGRIARFTSTVGTNALGSFKFKVTDSQGASLTNQINLRLIASPANTAPSLPPISNRVINPGVTLLITNNATDADIGQMLTYSLPVKPTNATINTSSGLLNWRPQVNQADTTNAFSVVVMDNGSPSLSATQSFSVIVNPLTLPSVAAAQVSNGQIGFTVNGQVGPDYAVQGSSNLMDWDTLLITNPATMPFNWNTNVGTLPNQYYRIKVGPPLP